MPTSSWKKSLNLCLLLSLSFWLGCARALDIMVVADDPRPAIQTFASRLEAIRPHDRVRLVATADMPAWAGMDQDTRLILIGSQLLDRRQKVLSGPPSLVLQISRVQARQIMQKRQPPNITLLWSDPPVARQLNLIRELLPQAKRIGVLYGGDSSFLVNELRQAAADLGLQVNAQFWPNHQDVRPLHRLLDHSDVLFGLSDHQLYNSSTIKTQLLSSYGRRIPLIGPTAAFVRAGSLASTYSDLNDWLKSLDQLLDNDPHHWPTNLYPESFHIMQNLQVGRSLGIPLGKKDTLVKRLQHLEKTP